MIQHVTSSRYMPPWQPDPQYSHFLEENYLNDEEINTISQWLAAGSPQGDPSLEPPLPDFPEGSQLGTPDLVLTMAEAHLHRGNGRDSYYYFVLPNTLTEDRKVKAIELRPGNPQIVHHCLFFEDATGQSRERDAATPEYGYDGLGDFGIAQALAWKQYPGYVPGTKPRYFPDGQGQTMTAGADLVLQMHYAPWPVDAFDQSTVNIFFADESEEVVDREVKDHIMLPFPSVINDNFVILPNQKKVFHGVWEPLRDISIMGISPHMHYLGESWEVYIEHQDGSTTPLISIPEWDFNWQGAYYFDRLWVAKRGDRVHAIAGYDNTAENPQNPSHPPITVSWGERTEDEMYYLPIMYLDYRDGDEDIRYTGTVSADEVAVDRLPMRVAPSPAHAGEQVRVDFGMAVGGPVRIDLLDLRGQLLRSLRAGEYFGAGEQRVWLATDRLQAGAYLLRVSTAHGEAIKKIVIH